MNGINRKIELNRDKCSRVAAEIFLGIAKLNEDDPRNEAIRKRAAEIREILEDRISLKAVLSYFDAVDLEGRDLKIGDILLNCNGFEQIDPKTVKGAYVYMLTAGDFALEGYPALDQFLADLWGTAFTDAGRLALKEAIEADAANWGLKISDGFGPGFYGMKLEQMKTIAELASNEAVDIEVSGDGTLKPEKSCGGVVLAVEDDYCLLQGECLYCSGNESGCQYCLTGPTRNSSEAPLQCTGLCESCRRCFTGEDGTTASLRKSGMLAFPEDFVPETDGEGLGIAFDIGTTTIAGMLWDLKKGSLMAAQAVTNPQSYFGADVISRIAYCGGDPERLTEIRKRTIGGLNELTNKLCQSIGRSSRDISAVAIAGNTTMSHIFAGKDPAGLAFSPFKPAFEGALELKASKCGLADGPNAGVFVMPGIAGHVGGDITAGILATRILTKPAETILFLDIGTNGEIVATDGVRTLACSTAAGPAFEGASISCGTRAIPGAIEKVNIIGDIVKVETVDCLPAIGICGSGLIDALAAMLNAGLISNTGRLASSEEWPEKHPHSQLGPRLRNGKNGREFVLAVDGDSKEVVITQKDIREVQLAKAAISTGISILLGKLQILPPEISKVVIAGAFGNFINVENAMRIGLLPAVDLNHVSFCGNAAGAGVSMALVSRKEKQRAKEIPGRIEHVELADEPGFQEEYLKAMELEINQ